MSSLETIIEKESDKDTLNEKLFSDVEKAIREYKDKILPKIYINGPTAILSYCYWNSWKGLVWNEYEVKKNGISVEFTLINSQDLISYKSNIIF